MCRVLSLSLGSALTKQLTAMNRSTAAGGTRRVLLVEGPRARGTRYAGTRDSPVGGVARILYIAYDSLLSDT